LFLAAALVVINSDARFSKYQSQIFQGMLLWTAFSVIYIMHTSDRRPQSLIALVPPLSYFVSHLFLLIRRRRIAEWSLWALLIGVFLVSTFSRYGRIEGIDYSRLQVRDDREVKGKKVLVLTNDVSWYAGNTLATPFLDWKLAEPVFTGLDYYENVIAIDQGFNDRPDVIIDPDRRMDAVFDRIPRLREMYREEGSGRYVAVR
jgi:drug/metabolite transporter (DMT)-like permease